MSDGAISQDEIDALLSGVSVDGLNSSGHVSGGPAVHINAQTLTTFAGNLSAPFIEKLNSMTGANFTGGTPTVEILDRDGLLAKIPEVVVSVTSDFSSGMAGEHLYLLAPELAQKIVNLITKEENADFDEMALNCISEVVAMHSGTEIQELDKTGKFPGLASNPPEAANSPKAILRIPQNKFPLISYPISLDGQTYTLWECLGGEVGEQISNAYGGNDTAELESVPASDNVASSAGMNQMNQMGGMQPQMNLGMNQMGMQSQMGMNMNQMAMQPQMNMGMNQMAMNPMGMQQMPMGQNMGMNMPNVQTLQYPNLQGSNVPGEQGNISLIMDVYMEMTVELGRTKKQIKEILGMGEGTIIELDKLAGEPVDILVNHKPIAKGEVVVIDENFGVRVTEILSPLERVSDLH